MAREESQGNAVISATLLRAPGRTPCVREEAHDSGQPGHDLTAARRDGAEQQLLVAPPPEPEALA